MPHVSIKMYPGRSDEIKAKLAKAVKETVVSDLSIDPKFVSVSVEDIEKENWNDEVVAQIADKDLFEKANF